MALLRSCFARIFYPVGGTCYRANGGESVLLSASANGGGGMLLSTSPNDGDGVLASGSARKGGGGEESAEPNRIYEFGQGV